MTANSRPPSAAHKSGQRSTTRSNPKRPAQARKPKPKLRETIGGILEPDWSRLLPDVDECAAASEHWRRVAGEMDAQQILSPSNGHALQRLVMAYLVYDRCSLMVGIDGIVTGRNKDNPKSIDRLSIYYQAMREAEKTTERLEQQLGLTPGKRGKVGKVNKPRERSAGADAFLGPRPQT